MPFSNKANTNCKSKGSQCCTPINLHVCIMQLVWIPSMCRVGCQVVCLLTHVCSCIHTPTVSKRLSAVACGKEWLLCWDTIYKKNCQCVKHTTCPEMTLLKNTLAWIVVLLCSLVHPRKHKTMLGFQLWAWKKHC